MQFCVGTEVVERKCVQNGRTCDLIGVQINGTDCTTVRFLRFRNTLRHWRDVLRWHKKTNFPHILIHKLWSVLNNNTMHLPNNRNSQYQCTNPISPAWGIHNTATLEIHVARQCCSTRFRGVTRHARQPISSGPLHRSRSQIGFVGGIVVAL